MLDSLRKILNAYPRAPRKTIQYIHALRVAAELSPLNERSDPFMSVSITPEFDKVEEKDTDERKIDSNMEGGNGDASDDAEGGIEDIEWSRMRIGLLIFLL